MLENNILSKKILVKDIKNLTDLIRNSLDKEELNIESPKFNGYIERLLLNDFIGNMMKI